MKRIYLDHNATTQVLPEAVSAMLPYFTEKFGNASSVHEFGRTAGMAVSDTRDLLAKFTGAHEPNEIIFTGGGTESDNLAIKGIAEARKDKGNHIITSRIEHHAVLNACKYLGKNGFEVTYLPVDESGIVDVNALKDSIKKTTILVSVMLANNETGSLQPIKEISKIAKASGIIVHTDAVQGFGKIPVNVEDLGVDLLSLTAHKFYGPKGVGALYVRKGIKIAPQQHGGHHERNRRAGTENVPGIVGLGAAVKYSEKNMAADMERIKKLRDLLYQGIMKNIKYVKLNGLLDKTVPNTLNLGFKYLEGESILLNLDMEGIAASTGSACTSGSLEPSHVLMAMNVEAGDAQGSIRFSLGRANTQEEIEYVIETLPPIIERLRNMSPLYEG